MAGYEDVFEEARASAANLIRIVGETLDGFGSLTGPFAVGGTSCGGQSKPCGQTPADRRVTLAELEGALTRAARLLAVMREGVGRSIDDADFWAQTRARIRETKP